MGFLVDKGEKFEKTCRACKELVVIIATGADICDCPYCGHTLMDHEASEEDLELSIKQAQQAIMQYRNTSDEYSKETTKLLLKNKLRWLLNDLEFCGKDQSRFHQWSCSCGWSGFEPKMILPRGEAEGTIECPKCGLEPKENHIKAK